MTAARTNLFLGHQPILTGMEQTETPTRPHTNIVHALDTIRHTPLGQIGVTRATAVAKPIITRAAADDSVDVARFGSFI
jgi:hypothetical protein